MNKNIVLIGMPGCGKTTAGKLLSEKIEYDFVDMDQYIKEKYGETIKQMFNRGEEHFRERESSVCQELSIRNNTVIATGGGVVKKEQNIKILGSSGIIVYIDRPLDLIISDIDMSSRPLLNRGEKSLHELYNERCSLYKKYSNITVKNNSSLDELVEKMIYALKLSRPLSGL